MHQPARHTGRVAAVAGAATLATLLASGVAVAAALAPDDTQIVTVNTADETTNDAIGATPWVEQAYDCNDETGPWLVPDQSFRNGPAKPVLGTGSHEMRTTQFGGDTQLFRTGQYDGTYVDDIVHLAYSTYTDARSGTDVKQPASLRLSIDTDGNGSTDESLWYEPSASHPGAVENGEWQSWVPTDDGEKWVVGGDESVPGAVVTWADIQSTYGDAVLSNTENGGGVAFVVGCAGANQSNGQFDVDGFGIETTADHADATADPVAQYVDFEDGGIAADDQGVLTVDANNTHGWDAGAYNDTDYLDPNQSMVFGPGNPPFGFGSHKFRLTDAEHNVVEVYRTTELDGTLVGDIRDLDYWSYQQPDAGNSTLQQPAYLRLSIDLDGDNVGDDQLYYEPAIEHGADIANNTWQHWTGAAQGLWSRSGAGDSDADLTTLAGYASHHPQATLAAPAETTGPGGLSIIVGAGGTGQDDANFYVDGLHVRYFDSGGQSTEKTYDFEPVVPKPTISAPRRVTGPTTVTVHGTAVPNSTVTLFEKRYGHDTEQVGSTTADDNGKYSFERKVRKQTKFRVRNYDKFSDVAKTNVRVELDLRTSSPNEGRLKMVAVTHPHATGEKVRFFHIRRNGERDLLGTCRVHDTGRCGVRVNAPSGRTWTLFATVTSPPGNLAGHSAKVRQTIR